MHARAMPAWAGGGGRHASRVGPPTAATGSQPRTYAVCRAANANAVAIAMLLHLDVDLPLLETRTASAGCAWSLTCALHARDRASWYGAAVPAVDLALVGPTVLASFGSRRTTPTGGLTVLLANIPTQSRCWATLRVFEYGSPRRPAHLCVRQFMKLVCVR